MKRFVAWLMSFAIILSVSCSVFAPPKMAEAAGTYWLAGYWAFSVDVPDAPEITCYTGRVVVSGKLAKAKSLNTIINKNPKRKSMNKSFKVAQNCKLKLMKNSYSTETENTAKYKPILKENQGEWPLAYDFIYLKIKNNKVAEIRMGYM